MDISAMRLHRQGSARVGPFDFQNYRVTHEGLQQSYLCACPSFATTIAREILHDCSRLIFPRAKPVPGDPPYFEGSYIQATANTPSSRSSDPTRPTTLLTNYRATRLDSTANACPARYVGAKRLLRH